MIRKATKFDIEELKALWLNLYEDDIEYIDSFFNNFFDFCTAFVYEIDSTIIGVMYLLPITVIPDKKAMYWYAGGIKDEYRNKGYFRKLCAEIMNYTKFYGYVNICVPGKGLSDFYKKIGFTYTYKKKSILLEEYGNEKIDISDFNLFDFGSIIKNDGDAIWNIDLISSTVNENIISGGKNIKIKYNEKEYIFLVMLSENKITSFDSDENSVIILAKNIMKHYNLKTSILEILGTGNEIYAMTDYPVIGENSKFYFNMV